MASRSSLKPTATERYAPHFAAGWDGRHDTPIACADCGLPAYVGLTSARADAAEVAHVDPDDQRWWKGDRSNVTVCCRSCNQAHGDRVADHLSPLPVTVDHRRASRAYVQARRGQDRAEHERRAAARAARWGA